MDPEAPATIGQLRESTLHKQLKEWYAQPGDALEQKVEGYWVDLVRGQLLVEFQTGNFAGVRKKLARLCENHPLRVVYPLARTRWLLTLPAHPGQLSRRRKSPKAGRVEHLFGELVFLPELMAHPNFSIEVVIIEEEELRRCDGKGSWRRAGCSLLDRRLIRVIEQVVFNHPTDFLPLLPASLSRPFTTLQLAQLSGLSINLAQRMTYCLRKMGVMEEVGKSGRARLFNF